jgi:UDP-glucose:(heptosyl)LPS alpha-1,3-glucosyltransferase
MSFLLNPHHLVLLYLEKKCFFNSKTILANSMMVKKDILKHYSVPEEKIKVVYNGIDLQRFQPAEKNQKTALKDFFRLKEYRVILFVGSDYKRKGLTTLLKALSLLKMKDVKLIVIGSKDTSRYLLLARELGVDKNVIFWGGEKEIEKLYRLADVFVLPTLYDPFSNATLEAMASGVPVVTTSYNGASELIENGVQGFVIDYPLNSKAFAEKIYLSLQHAEDLGKKARMKVENYSIEKAVDNIIEIISENMV